MRLRPLTPAHTCSAALVLVLVLGCSSTARTAQGGAGAAPGGPCPTAAVPVVVSIDQWGDIVKQLAGQCGEVTTLLEGSSADPHDYEPTPIDTARFGGAEVVVVNGAGYDAWATRAVEALPTKPAVVDGAEVVGAGEGANPHIWYSPDAVDKVSKAITDELKKAAPAASAYFDERAADWQRALQPYRDEIATVRKAAAGKRYAATEPVFDAMADAVGLERVTPQGYQNAATNESDAAPGDVHDFQMVLENKQADVLVFNAQTEGAIPDLLRERATKAAVPVVDVTETVPPGTPSFVQWQVSQLQALATALA